MEFQVTVNQVAQVEGDLRSCDGARRRIPSTCAHGANHGAKQRPSDNIDDAFDLTRWRNPGNRTYEIIGITRNNRVSAQGTDFISL